MDPVYGYQAVNAEAEMRNSSSFLHWMRRMLAVRHQHSNVLGAGSLQVLEADNPAVLATSVASTIRSWMCVNNVSRAPQPAQLELGGFVGLEPVELLGGARFPVIAEAPYLVTLPSHGFFWFSLVRPGP